MQRMPHEVKSIHYLRGLAALLVVFHHSIIQLAPVRDHYAHVEFGQAGVDIFFVISGFVIYLSNGKGRLGSGEFLKRRIIRIVPLYWLATLAVVAVAVVAPRFFATTTLTAQDVAQSLLFVPAYSAAFPSQIWPVLVPGWSLNYEMFFYLVFAVGLLVARERLLLFLVATLGILVVAGLLLDPHLAPLKSYTDLRLLEFLFGVLLARLYLDMGLKGLSGLGILLPAGLLLLAISPALPMLQLGKIPPWALPAALIVTGALAMEKLLVSTSSPLLQLMGDASYALYLSHLFTLGALRAIWAKAGVPVDNPQWTLLWFGVALSASVVVGIAVHKWLEKPLLSAGRNLLGGRPTARWRKVPMRSTGVPGE
jgi:exopolysaccharide production protein ExoZ